MGSDSKMRMPYGPGWEDPDWTPYAPTPDAESAMQAPEAASLPVVGSLAQYMAVVKRVAVPRRTSPRLPALTTPTVSQTRRWVMAGGAGLVALAALPGSRAITEDPANETTSLSKADERIAGDPLAGPERRRS